MEKEKEESASRPPSSVRPRHVHQSSRCRSPTSPHDSELRKKKKWSRYDGTRPIMWDMTNVTTPAFSDASLQRITYSEYYGENCFKAGIFAQLCGWIGNEDLWGGGASDSDYNTHAGYLEDQEKFQQQDLVKDDDSDGGKVIKFVNVLDRGY